jgi:ATP-dependent DNA helicase RecQ
MPDAGWSGIRQQVLLRDGHRCLSCGMEVTSAEADIHHLLPRSMGGSDELSNLVTLCEDAMRPITRP